jgi:predicted transcriptional regulator of viral defense system
MKMALKEDIGPLAKAPPRKRAFVDQFLNESQARGELVISIDQLARTSQMTHLALRRQLERLSQRVQHLPGRPSAYLIVSPEHRARGAPPVAAWLDAYFRVRNQPYYVGLLSAAALHGSSSQALQVTQVLTTKPTRPMDVGRLHVDFYVKAHLQQTPLSALAGMPAPLAVSSPEATALDLIAFSDRIGGIRRVTEVIASLQGVMSLVGLRAALRAENQTSLKQRLGYVLSILGLDRMAEEVQRTLPKRLAVALLQTQAPVAHRAGDAHQPWMVLDNVGLETERK